MDKPDFSHIFVGGGTVKPNPAMCCERCVYGTGKHAEWCSYRLFGSLPVRIDPSLPPGVIELRDRGGQVVGAIFNVGR